MYQDIRYGIIMPHYISLNHGPSNDSLFQLEEAILDASPSIWRMPVDSACFLSEGYPPAKNKQILSWLAPWMQDARENISLAETRPDVWSISDPGGRSKLRFPTQYLRIPGQPHFIYFIIFPESLDSAECSSLFPHFLFENVAKQKKSMEKAAKSKNLETWLKNEKNDLEFKKWKKKSGMKKMKIKMKKMKKWLFWATSVCGSKILIILRSIISGCTQETSGNHIRLLIWKHSHPFLAPVQQFS